MTTSGVSGRAGAADGGAHPLLGAAAALARALDDALGAVAAGSDPAWLPPGDQAVLLEGLGRAQQRLDALLMHTLTSTGAAGGVTDLDASRTPADWLARRLRVRPGRLAGQTALGEAVRRRPTLASALAGGELTVDHARAVTDVLAELPAAELDRATLEDAERALVGYCEVHTPPEVRHLGRHLLEVVAPDTAEALEAERLAREEREARRTTTLLLRRTGHGTRRVIGEIPELAATLLERSLRAYTNPRRPDADDGQRLTDSQRLGQALCALVEHLPTDGLPTHGRTPVTVTVLVDEQSLRRDVTGAGVATLDTGERISPGELRRLACAHGILPAVLDGDSHVLDVGHEQRFFTRVQVTALRIAHPECQADGCTIPAAWCEAHHRTPWACGGRTDLADGALLCGHHHRRAHDPRYRPDWRGDGSVTFHMRC